MALGFVRPEWNELTRTIIGRAMEVHSVLGPGLTERLYEEALCFELGAAGLSVERQLPMTVRYKHLELGVQKLDIVVNRLVVVELKAVEAVIPAHFAQLVSYLRAANFPVGLLINFNEAHLRDGIHRRLNTGYVAPPAVSLSTPPPSSSGIPSVSL